MAGRAQHLFKIFNVAEIRVDEIGVGSGVVDILFERGLPVVGVNVESRAVKEPDKYFNLRAELWFNFAEWLRQGKIPDSDLLIRDLCSVHYSFRSDGTYQIESKDEIIKRLTYSPDYGDSAVLGTPPDLGRVRGSSDQKSASRSFSTKALGEKLTGSISNYSGNIRGKKCFSGLSTMKVALIILAIVILFVAVLVKVSVKLADAEKLKVFESQVDLSNGGFTESGIVTALW